MLVTSYPPAGKTDANGQYSTAVRKIEWDKTVGGGKPGAWSPVPCRYRLGHQSVRVVGGRPLPDGLNVQSGNYKTGTTSTGE